jgi:hypothetical protein
MSEMKRILAAMVVVVAAVGLACERSEPTDEERSAIEGRITAYLHALADAYSSLDASALSEYATGSETSEVTTMIRGLVGTGDRVEARLLSVEFTSLTVFREINANVTANEVWEVVRYDAFSGREKGRTPTSVQDTMFQLRKVDGTWMITARRVNPQGEPSEGTDVVIPSEAGE